METTWFCNIIGTSTLTTDLETKLTYNLSAMSFGIDGIKKAGLLGQGGGMLEDTELPGIFPKKNFIVLKCIAYTVVKTMIVNISIGWSMINSFSLIYD